MNLLFRSESKSISRLCSKCLVPQKRLAEHVAVCCATMTAKERLDAIAGEHERGKALCVVAYQLEALKEDFPASYLDIATVLIRSNIPVYTVTAEKRPPKVWYRETERLSAEDVNRLRQTVQATSANRECATEVLSVERSTEPNADKSDNDPSENAPDIAANVMPTEQQRPAGSGVSKRRRASPRTTPVSRGTLCPEQTADHECASCMWQFQWFGEYNCLSMTINTGWDWIIWQGHSTIMFNLEIYPEILLDIIMVSFYD